MTYGGDSDMTEYGPCGCCEMARPNPNQRRNAAWGLLACLIAVALAVTVAVVGP